MRQTKLLDLTQLLLRLASGFSFFYYGCDRLGFWGKYGAPNVSWGDWSHFMDYSSRMMGFLPYSIAQVFAAMATAGEIASGLLLVVGFKTKWAALAVFILAGSYAIAMTVSFGVFAPLQYSVFTFSLAGLLLFCVDRYKWSIDSMLAKGRSRPTLSAVERFNAAFNLHDVNAVMQAMTEDCVFENTSPGPDGTRLQGAVQVRAYWEKFFAANPDAYFEAEEIIAAADRYVVRWIYHKTKEGKPWHLRGVDIFKVTDGKVAEKLAYVKG